MGVTTSVPAVRAGSKQNYPRFKPRQFCLDTIEHFVLKVGFERLRLNYSLVTTPRTRIILHPSCECTVKYNKRVHRKKLNIYSDDYNMPPECSFNTTQPFVLHS
jgi:hypothetical protein